MASSVDEEWDVLLHYCIANPGEEVDPSEDAVRRKGICTGVGAGATISDAVEAVKRASGLKQVDDVHRLRLGSVRSWVAIGPQAYEYVCKKGDEFFFRLIRRVPPPASHSVTAATSGWVRLARAMRQQKCDAAEVFVGGNVLRLDTKAAGMEDSRGALWVHLSYVTLMKRMTKLMERGQNRFHLIGAQGCGKSAFGFLWLYYLACQRQKILLRAIDGKTWVLFDFSGDDVEVLQSESQFSFVELVNDQTWLIVDGASRPIIHPGPVLQCVSDKKKNHHDFAKTGTYLYMNAWTLEECEAAAVACGWQIDDLPQRFHYIGGVPSYLFEPLGSAAGAKALVDRALVREASRLEDLFSKPWTINDVWGPLFRYRYRQYFLDEECLMRAGMKKELVLGSDYVMEKADEFLKLSTGQECGRWINSVRWITGPELAPLFETRVHEKMVGIGGKFRCRCLQSRNMPAGATGEWEITPPATSKTIYKWKLMDSVATLRDPKFSILPRRRLNSLGADSYVRALSGSQKSWDSFRTKREADGKVLVHIYQVTISLDHPVEWDGISELMRMLTGALQPLIASFVLVFVVPADKFADFKAQSFVREVNTTAYRKYEKTPDIDQYVLEFKW